MAICFEPVSRAFRGKMRHKTLACFFFALLLSLVAFAQDSTKPDRIRQMPAATQRFSRKAASLSGMVSDDGKFFLADPDSEVWTVANPEALRSYQGHRVVLQAQTSPESNEIRVLCVKSGEGQMQSASRQGDAAFRR